jgi:hypothetical protein
LPHIFDEYYQGTEGAERGGFGLGLAIVKRLGDILDHRVEVRTIRGKGTRFLIEVPRGQSSVKGRKQRHRCILTMMPSGAAFSRLRTRRPCAWHSEDY